MYFSSKEACIFVNDNKQGRFGALSHIHLMMRTVGIMIWFLIMINRVQLKGKKCWNSGEIFLLIRNVLLFFLLWKGTRYTFLSLMGISDGYIHLTKEVSIFLLLSSVKHDINAFGKCDHVLFSNIYVKKGFLIIKAFDMWPHSCRYLLFQGRLDVGKQHNYLSIF